MTEFRTRKDKRVYPVGNGKEYRKDYEPSENEKIQSRYSERKRKNLWIKVSLKDWLYMWHEDTNKYDKFLGNETYIITYKSGEIKRISLQDYNGEKVPRQNIENIELISGDWHGDYYGDL